MNEAPNELDVLVLAPFGKDSALIAKVLEQSGTAARVLASAKELTEAVLDSAGAAIISEEALCEREIVELAGKLESQPPWSDLPIIVLTGGGMSTAATEHAVRTRAPLGNVTLLERPFRPATLISTVKGALSARRHQYEIRDHLQQRKLAEDALRKAHDTLESIVEERTAALRRLSAQLLHVQDEERRHIARELHDGLGQYLAAAKLTLDTLALARNDDSGFSDAIELIGQAIKETRTLSHLLHPPLLDAAGLTSAVSWYVEGFAKRSGIKADLTLPEKPGRLPVAVETALFRIMQEALTNVYRHSGSSRVTIAFSVDEANARLEIRDFGKGIPERIVENFHLSGTDVGVGLAGIRERVKELGGRLEVSSGSKGTTIIANVPVAESGKTGCAPEHTSQIYSSLAS